MSIDNSQGSSTAVPAIIGVVDSNGGPIGNPGTTQATALTLSGIGTASAVVTILDNGQMIGTASVPGGTWSKSVTALVGPHSYTVREGGGVESGAWVVTVESAEVTPRITSVRDSIGEILNGGETFETTVDLRGTAAASQRVEILNGTISLDVVAVTGNGDWTAQLTALRVATYSITVKGLYGSEPLSPVHGG